MTPLFGRGSKNKGTPSAPDNAIPQGTEPCQAHGCPNHNGVRCQYVDRRRRHCETAWCPSHAAVVGGSIYCRRHAGTIAAIGFTKHPLGLPDLDNRAPSLTNWVARDLDGFIAALLSQVAVAGESFVREPMVKVFTDRLQGRRFERHWKLVDHTGVSLGISIFVFEDDDTTVHVKVGSGIVAQGVPPWIGRRHTGTEVADDVDGEQRRRFYAFLQQHIVAGVQATRARDRQYRYE